MKDYDAFEKERKYNNDAKSIFANLKNIDELNSVESAHKNGMSNDKYSSIEPVSTFNNLNENN